MAPLASTGLTIRTALSTHVDAVMAAEAVCEEVLGAAETGWVDLAILFISGDHARHAASIARVVHGALGAGTLIGVTADGVIGDDQEIEEHAAVSLWCAALPGVKLRTFTTSDLPTAPKKEDLKDFAHDMELGSDLRGMIFFADPFSVPVASVLEVLSAVPDAIEGLKGCPVLGGIASAARVPGQNALILNESIQRTGGVGVAISGNIAIDTLVSQGCRPIGEPLLVTKAKRNIIIELAGQRPLDIVREMVDGLPEHDRDLLTGGLHVGRVINEYKSRFGRGDFLIRGLMGYDPKSGAIAVADGLRVGQTVQFHLRDAETASEDIELLLMAQRLRGPAAGGLLITCQGRGRKLFDRPDHDAQCVRDALTFADTESGAPPPLAGFFAAGEIGPIGERSFVHGHTACLALFRPLRPTI